MCEPAAGFHIAKERQTPAYIWHLFMSQPSPLQNWFLPTLFQAQRAHSPLAGAEDCRGHTHTNHWQVWDGSGDSFRSVVIHQGTVG